MGGFTFREMLLNSWPIISVLGIMSIISLTVILDRFTVLRRARLNAMGLAGNLLKILKANGSAEAVEYCQRFSQPAAKVMEAIIIHGPTPIGVQLRIETQTVGLTLITAGAEAIIASPEVYASTHGFQIEPPVAATAIIYKQPRMTSFQFLPI